MSLIIVVDDDQEIRNAISRILKRMGNLTVLCENGEEALRSLEVWKDTAALIISDVNMPVMDGKQLFARVRATCPDLPFILMTGGSDKLPSDDRTQHLAKPLNFDAFTKAVDAALQMSSPRS
ncbi:MAG: response regulator [Patescibacteria group bacterium]|nr:response regulator [Patescibacteria group bacterium]